MVMLDGYGHIVDFFTALEWWKAEPRPELASGHSLCLGELGRRYVVYLFSGGKVEVTLEAGSYAARWYNPRNGEYVDIGSAEGPKWTSPEAPDDEDWVLLVTGEGARE